MKSVALTVKNIESSEPWLRILDPKDDLDDLIAELREQWSFDLYTRSPRAALLSNGVLKPTDLDLACFLSALGDRGAVITLPEYARRRPATVRENVRVVSNENRHGKVLGLTSNKDVFSFSVKVQDMNVVTQDDDGNEEVGAPRNFMLVDLNGLWHDGWRTIEFSPSRKENAFLDDKKLWTGRTIFFDNFVHPNRWTSFYGKWYLLTKLLIERLKAEASHCFQEAKAIKLAGITLPETSPEAEKDWSGQTVVGNVASISVAAFEAEIEAEVPRDFAPYPRTAEGLAAARRRLLKLRYNDVPNLSFATRATELAFSRKAECFKALPVNELDVDAAAPPEPFPSWISGAKWERGHKVKRTSWNRLVLAQSVPFMKGLALRYRVHHKLERVAG